MCTAHQVQYRNRMINLRLVAWNSMCVAALINYAWVREAGRNYEPLEVHSLEYRWDAVRRRVSDTSEMTDRAGESAMQWAM